MYNPVVEQFGFTLIVSDKDFPHPPETIKDVTIDRLGAGWKATVSVSDHVFYIGKFGNLPLR